MERNLPHRHDLCFYNCSKTVWKPSSFSHRFCLSSIIRSQTARKPSSFSPLFCRCIYKLNNSLRSASRRSRTVRLVNFSVRTTDSCQLSSDLIKSGLFGALRTNFSSDLIKSGLFGAPRPNFRSEVTDSDGIMTLAGWGPHLACFEITFLAKNPL